MHTFRSIFLISFVSALSGLLFGYDAGIISGAMLFIKHSFVLSNTAVGTIVSAVPLGALISAICVGKISDVIGRKKVLIATGLFFAVGSLLCAYAQDVSSLIIGRFLMGIAVGMSSASAPMYIAEIAEQQRRGALVTLYLIAVNGGLFVAYFINYIFANTGAWRLMLGLGMVPAAILIICGFLLPESPRWLILKNYATKALTILENIHGKLRAQQEFIEINAIVRQEKIAFINLMQSHFLKVIVLGIMISIFTQAVGINAIIYYAPTIFQQTGFSKSAIAILATMGIGLTVTLAAVVATVLLDKVGRRKLLLGGLAGIIASWFIIIYAFAYIKNPQLLGWLTLIGSILFVACQGISVGPACFLLPSEIFPAKIRGTGMGISIAFNWLTNTLVAFLFPIVLSTQGAVSAFTTFLILSITGWIYFYLFVPETKNVSLEKIELNILKGEKTRYLGEKNLPIHARENLEY